MAKPTSKKNWSLLVYMAGDNNLTEEMVWGLQEMKKASANSAIRANVNVVAQFDARGVDPRCYYFNSPKANSEPEQIQQDGNLSDYAGDLMPIDQILDSGLLYMAEDCLSGYGTPNDVGHLLNSLRNLDEEMATALVERLELDPSVKTILKEHLKIVNYISVQNAAAGTLKAFVRRLVDADLLADNYMVVLSGHGSGTMGDFLPDSDPGSSLSIPKLARLLELALEEYRSQKVERPALRKIRILGMDSCLMSNVEVAYEVRDHVEYLVASEGFAMNTGWPYHRVLETLAGTPEASDAAIAIVESYIQFYKDYEIGDLSVDLAACDLARMDELRDAIKHLVEKLLPRLNLLDPDEEQHELNGNGRSVNGEERGIRNALILAHWYAQSYKREQYTDLHDFCQQLKRFLPPGTADIAACCDEVKAAIEKVVLKSCYCGPEFQHSHGLSIFFPWSANDYPEEYDALEFAKATKWREFLHRYLLTTQRMRRWQGDKMKSGLFDAPLRFGNVYNLLRLLERSGRRTEIAPRCSGTMPLPDATSAAESQEIAAPPVEEREHHSMFHSLREMLRANAAPETGTKKDSEAGTKKDSEAGTKKFLEAMKKQRDSEAGTKRDSEAGTKKFLETMCRGGSMKNPPDGFYAVDCQCEDPCS